MYRQEVGEAAGEGICQPSAYNRRRSIAAVSTQHSCRLLMRVCITFMIFLGLMKGLCGPNAANMTHLILNSCSSVLDDFVKKFCVLAGHSMKHLDLRSCLHITDPSVHYISKYMKKLQVYWFEYSNFVKSLSPPPSNTVILHFQNIVEGCWSFCFSFSRYFA